MKRMLKIILWAFLPGILAGQEAPFSVSLEPLVLKDMPGLQSYAFARSGHRILLIGGTRDGLHRRQPFASFLPRYNNTEMLLLDMNMKTIRRQPVTGFPAPLAEQLQSSNMQFCQDGNRLLLTGGYGYSATRKDHITHPGLVLIEVNELMDAIAGNKDPLPFIRQVRDERMAITGGKMLKLQDHYYLLAGQRFEGRYNPHGPDHGPGFTQEYSNQVSRFRVDVNKSIPQILDYTATTDTALFHRRDLNALPQLDDQGTPYLTLFSGVFQYQEDIPYTNLVDIQPNGHEEVKGFKQQFSHYHTASMGLYSRNQKTMYSLFLGGIAQRYIDSTGTVITDNDVPFVKTISLVERKGKDVREYALPESMPGYFGAVAEFIPVADLPLMEYGILDADKLDKKARLVGYVIGGIDSRAPHVFWNNDPERSRASPVIWEVYLHWR